ncbi:MAG: hypothetical protein ACP5T0_02975 [Verrucomicrobiia bacterium]
MKYERAKYFAQTISLLIALIFLFSQNATVVSGASSTQSQATSKNSASRGRPFHGIIKTVDYTSEFIVLEGKSAQTFYVNSNTTIKIDGKAAKFKDISAGHYVGGYARENADGRWVATTLNINTAKSKNSGSNK